ncbi:MAG: outer membrane lipoprotein carrier protein LolA [Candidatus Kapabacteria bacterium]|nr:outer membrane lipoprotein carrier protein LolA [Candidatus Kapabacteria bacterium]
MNRRDAMHVLLGLSAFIAFTPNAFAGGDLLDRFQARYRSANTIRCTFTTASGSTGSIIAMRGGKYRVTVPDRTIISNGKTVWSVTASAKSVIMNTYRAQSNDLSLEKVFFDVMNIYKGQIIERGRIGGTIRLTPQDSRTVIAGVTKAEVTLDESMRATRIVLTENGTTTVYTISKMVINPKVKASTFTYSPPKGWELIDLR